MNPPGQFTPSSAVSISLALALFGVAEAIGGFVVNISITVAPRLLKYQIMIIDRIMMMMIILILLNGHRKRQSPKKMNQLSVKNDDGIKSPSESG